MRWLYLHRLKLRCECSTNAAELQPLKFASRLLAKLHANRWFARSRCRCRDSFRAQTRSRCGRRDNARSRLRTRPSYALQPSVSIVDCSRISPLIIGISDSREQSCTIVTNTFSPRLSSLNTGVLPAAPRPRFPRTRRSRTRRARPPRLADTLAQDCPAQEAVVAVGGVAVHPADIRRLRRRQIVFEAQENPVPFLCRKSLFYH